MLTVQSVVPAGAAGQRWQDAGDKKPMKASRFFALGIGIAIVALLILPGAWIAYGGTNESPMGVVIRLAVFCGSLATMATMMIAIGMGVTGQRMGVLWTARNAYSLSRLQVTLWTLLVLSALAGVVVCRAHGLFLAPGSGGVGGALNIDIPNELLYVMGVSVLSGAASPALLSLKTVAPPPPPDQMHAAVSRSGGGLQTIGNVTTRAAECPPMVKDLFQGDEVSKVGTVDMGKLQQGLVTAILWCSYLAMLTQLFAVGLSPHQAAVAGGTALPLMPQAFVYLLGISHVGYLAYKASPAPGGTASVASGAGSTPSQALPRPLPPTI